MTRATNKILNVDSKVDQPSRWNVSGHQASALLMLLITAWIPYLSLADQSPASSISAGMQSGMVTAVREQTVEINGKEFGFSPEVVVLDHEGKETDLSYITRKSEVKFRLMKDGAYQIEKIIVQHPE
jgi:hypothetical protein